MKKLILRPGREKSVKLHHPWLFSGAVSMLESDAVPGEIVGVFSAKNEFLGQGFVNPESNLILHFLSFDSSKIDDAFFENRFDQAIAWRKEKMHWHQTNLMRLIYSEADYLPGLIVDQYADYLVFQISSVGMEKRRDWIIEQLKKLKPKGIYERSDSQVRSQEGLELRCQPVLGVMPDRIEVLENGMKFWVNLQQGQKTGFFIDQRDSRKMVLDWTRNAKVLNAFSYSGAFSVAAGLGGAKYVISLDSSEAALNLAQKNWELNGLENSKHQVWQADAFEALRELKEKKEKFDFIILDPPAFVKQRSSLEDAARGYKDINLQAMQILEPGGFLLSSSCSQHMDRFLFQKIVHDASVDAQRSLQYLKFLGAGMDHPIASQHPEGEYLKSLFCRVL